MQITYIASSGNTYDLTGRLRIKEANFHTWEYEPKYTELASGDRVTAFRKGASTYSAVLVIRGNRTYRQSTLSALHDDFETDIQNMTTGRLMFGMWYVDCYIRASQTNPTDGLQHQTENEIQIYVPSGKWIKETSKTFTPAEVTQTYLDYPYDYEYDYLAPLAGSETWATDTAHPCDFELTINGPVTTPRIVINGYPYSVGVNVPSGESLVINSREHTVMMGSTNCFDARNKEQSVFQKIPAGSLTLEWLDCTFTLTLMEERSEPRWS